MRKTIVTSEVIVLGRQGEDGANKVLFPVRGWKELYGDGQFVVTALRPDENDPYPVTTHIYEEDDPNVTRRGVFVEWIVGSADVEIPGRGKVELAYYTSDNVRVKSVVYHTVIYGALGQNSLTPPEPWESWVDDVREAGADAIQAAEDAAASAEGAAQAADDARDAADDASDAAENAAAAVSTAFGQITATATTLSPDSPATASFNPSTKVMSFGIPRGQDGGGGGGGGGEDNVFWATVGTTTHAEVGGAFNAGKMAFAKDENGNVYMLVSHYIDMYHDVFKFVCPMVDYVTPFLMVETLNENNQWDTSSQYLEREGRIRINYSDYIVSRVPLAITENGVTTTYYVADITDQEV